MDSSVAELIDSYKSLSPVMPDTDALLADMIGELEELRAANADLTEKLKASEETVNNMVNEFGNLFGGGDANDLADDEVAGKLSNSHDLA